MMRIPGTDSTTPRPLHVLVVDDNEAMRRSVVALLKSLQIRSTLATNGADAITLLSTGRFDLLLTDLEMPQMNGFELLEWVQSNQPDLPAVLMTGALTEHIARVAIEGGAAAVLSKPFGPSEFTVVLEKLFSESPACPKFAANRGVPALLGTYFSQNVATSLRLT